MEDNVTTASSGQDSSASVEKTMSKRQIRKLLKREKWLETKHERRKAEKLKKKQRLAERREKGEDVGRSRKSLKTNTMENSSCKIRVCLDLSLDQYMSEKDIASLTIQIQHCYSTNRRSENPMQLYACGLRGQTQERLDGIGDYKGWDVHFKEESYLEEFPKESIVYLSSESPNMLTSLSDDKVYVIGGLVDHNSHKGLCHRLAEENGVAHAQLPISEFLHLRGRKVLAVNHVFSILLRFTESGDWKQAFLSELPTRKGFAPVFDEADEAEENSKTVPKPKDECSSNLKGEDGGGDTISSDVLTTTQDMDIRVVKEDKNVDENQVSDTDLPPDADHLPDTDHPTTAERDVVESCGDGENGGGSQLELEGRGGEQSESGH